MDGKKIRKKPIFVPIRCPLNPTWKDELSPNPPTSHPQPPTSLSPNPQHRYPNPNHRHTPTPNMLKLEVHLNPTPQRSSGKFDAPFPGFLSEARRGHSVPNPHMLGRSYPLNPTSYHYPHRAIPAKKEALYLTMSSVLLPRYSGGRIRA